MMPIWSNAVRLAAAAGLLLVIFSWGCGIFEEADPSAPMKLGLLLDFADSPETAADRKRGFDLAIKHINEGGGVLGRPVEGIAADATRKPGPAVAAARFLVEENGVHAIVGPNASGAALPIVEAVIGPGRVPTVSPSATSPQLTESPDDDFFFRTTLSDIAQGPVLARVTREQGYDNVGLIYIDDAYGQGLAASFEETWEGTLEAVAVGADQTTYLPQLRQSAIAGGRALVIISFEAQALEIVRQALDKGIYQRFFFGDAAKRERLVREIGGALLGNMYGTAGSAAPDSQATVEWEESFMAEYGRLPEFPYVKETYDATVALALAAQAAGNLNGEAIRDQLRKIAGAPGQEVLGTPVGVSEGLALLADGREIDYEGVASPLDWDKNGDLESGYIGIWRFTEEEGIEELETVFFQQ